MKKYIKIKIIMILTIVTFLVGINNAKALVCEYYLPFSGITPDGKYVDPSIKNDPCYESSKGNLNCTARATIRSSVTADSGQCNTSYWIFGIPNYFDTAANVQADWGDIFHIPGYTDTESNGKQYDDYSLFYIYKMLGEMNGTSDLDRWLSGNGRKIFYDAAEAKVGESFSVEEAAARGKECIKDVGSGGDKISNFNDLNQCLFAILDEYDEKILKKGACPKYLIVQKKSNNIFKRNSKLYKKIFNKLDKLSGWCDAGDDANNILPISVESSKGNDYYYMSYMGLDGDDADEVYRKYLRSFYNQGSSSSLTDSNESDISFYDLDYYILPYYVKEYLYYEEEIPQVQNAVAGAEIFTEVFDEAWYNRMTSFEAELRSSCGNNWYDYINMKNYFSKSGKFFDYAQSSYSDMKNNLKNADKEITEECWNTRKRFMTAFESMQIFMYGMGSDAMTRFEKITVNANSTREFIDEFKKESDKNAKMQNLYYRVYMYDDKRTEHFNYLLTFFQAVKLGTDFTPEIFNRQDNELVNQKMKVNDNYNKSLYKYNMLRSDPCSYKCGNVISSDGYNSCKNHNTEYNKCVEALRKCGGKICTSCVNVMSDAAFLQCNKSCDEALTSTVRDCVENEGIENFATKRKEALDKALEEFTGAKQDKEDLDAASQYTYEPVATPSINFDFKEYEPKCSDVAIITNIWQIITLLAPFLVIIFGSIDYFKAVISSNEEEMKKSKQKFPKRLIAFTILLVLPILIKVLLSNFGGSSSSNLTLLKCIITGQTEDNTESSTTDTDNQSSNSSGNSNTNSNTNDEDSITTNDNDSGSSNNDTEKKSETSSSKKTEESESKKSEAGSTNENESGNKPVIDPGPRM